MSSSEDDCYYGNAAKLLGKKIKNVDSGDEDCEKIILSPFISTSLKEEQNDNVMDLTDTKENEIKVESNVTPQHEYNITPRRSRRTKTKANNSSVDTNDETLNESSVVTNDETLNDSSVVTNDETLNDSSVVTPLNNRGSKTRNRKRNRSKQKSRSNQTNSGRKETQTNRSRRRFSTSNENIEITNGNRRQTRNSTSRNKIPRDVPKETIVVLDSDEEIKHTVVVKNVDPKIVENLNSEISFKVWWQFRELNDFKLRRYQKLKTVFDFYSKRENIPHERLLLKIDNQIISPNDTPDTLEMNSTSVIEAGYLPKNRTVTTVNNNSTSELGKNSLQLKIQNQKNKKPWLINISKTDCIGLIMVKYSEEFELDITKLKFYFDGEVLNFTDTPEMLDLEGGECIDVYFK